MHRKKRVIRDYLIASASGDRTALENVLEASFVWTVPGEFQIKGRDEFIAELIANLQEVSTLEVQSLLSHGKEGSAHGTVTNKKRQTRLLLRHLHLPKQQTRRQNLQTNLIRGDRKVGYDL